MRIVDIQDILIIFAVLAVLALVLSRSLRRNTAELVNRPLTRHVGGLIGPRLEI